MKLILTDKEGIVVESWDTKDPEDYVIVYTFAHDILQYGPTFDIVKKALNEDEPKYT